MKKQHQKLSAVRQDLAAKTLQAPATLYITGGAFPGLRDGYPEGITGGGE